MAKIPISLDDAIQTLSNMGVDPERINGRLLRNEWGLWSGSVLARWFYNIEIYHADDMSGIVMDSYNRYKLGEPIELEEQIAKYHKYWKKEIGDHHLTEMRSHIEQFMIDEIRDKKIDKVLS